MLYNYAAKDFKIALISNFPSKTGITTPIVVDGIGTEDFCKVSWDNDSWEVSQSADGGHTIRSLQPCTMASMDLTLMISSLTNNALTILYNKDIGRSAGSGAGVGTFSVIINGSASGTSMSNGLSPLTIVAANGYITKPADVTGSKSSKERTWSIKLVDTEIVLDDAQAVASLLSQQALNLAQTAGMLDSIVNN